MFPSSKGTSAIDARIHLGSFRTTFTEFSSRHTKDERFRAVEKIRDRENWFHEYVQELKTRGKEAANRPSDKETVNSCSNNEHVDASLRFLAEERLFLLVERTESEQNFLLVRDETCR